MSYDVITMGSATRDIFLFLDARDAPVIANPRADPKREKLIALEYGAKIDVVSSARAIGGGGANAAVTFSRMGLTTAAVVRVGEDDDGNRILDALKQERVATAYAQRDPKLCTAFSALIVAGEKKRDRAVLTERGASSANNFSRFSRGITKAKWYYTSALSGKNWKKELRDISQTARTHGIKWAWNPGTAQIRAGLSALKPFMKHCSVFNVNRDEALELAGKRNSIKALLSSLLAAGPERVLVSDGINGVYCADSSAMVRMSADPSIRAMEPTGAGDALGSGFIAGLVAKHDITYALDVGLTNSESVICKIGAQEGILRLRELARAINIRKHTLSYV
ncbi:MAG: carbohydrate kinase family protein [Parcubacteria group bacterium]|nr:carbohydrate kinase family protein [Parcubacteria group bacterium]